MSDSVTITINQQVFTVPGGISVAAALFYAAQLTFRTSVSAQPRAAFCGMGICFECCLTIENRSHCKSCQILVFEGMAIRTT